MSADLENRRKEMNEIIEGILKDYPDVHITTVGELINDLKEYNEDDEIRFATSPNTNYIILSVYKGDNKNIVWVDLEEI